MNSKKSHEISALAELVRQSLDLKVPVDVVQAVELLGGTLKEIDSLANEPEATIRRTGERFEIIIKKNCLATRKRFSLAHELGHLFLHMGYLLDPDAWGHSSEYRDSVYHRFGYGIEEAEANLFAAAFLMPEKEFRSVVNELGNADKLPIRDLAQHFKTSAAAVLKRGEELGAFRVNHEAVA